MGPIKVLTRAVHKIADMTMFLVVGNDYTYIYNVSWVRNFLPISPSQAFLWSGLACGEYSCCRRSGEDRARPDEMKWGLYPSLWRMALWPWWNFGRAARGKPGADTLEKHVPSPRMLISFRRRIPSWTTRLSLPAPAIPSSRSHQQVARAALKHCHVEIHDHVKKLSVTDRCSRQRQLSQVAMCLTT